MSERPEPGSPVLLVFRDGSARVIIAERGRVLDTKHGRVLHDDVLSSAWGSTVMTSTGSKAFVFKPSLIDIQMHVAERVTQVIYPKDWCFMIAAAGVGPGSIVVEVGTGSGFLTMALACAVRPTGRVYTFDVRREFVDAARRNVGLSGCGDVVEFFELDAKSGIPVRGADAAFVDVPDPWNLLRPLHEALKSSGSLAVFLPTVNQVSKLLAESSKSELFGYPRVFEIMLREYQPDPSALRPISIQVAHTGYVVLLRRLAAIDEDRR
ncbi:MAG: tRNA (adenine-N1)-methyltransferase [Fervidicoccaceae archaeon]